MNADLVLDGAVLPDAAGIYPDAPAVADVEPGAQFGSLLQVDVIGAAHPDLKQPEEGQQHQCRPVDRMLSAPAQPPAHAVDGQRLKPRQCPDASQGAQWVQRLRGKKS
jgi:hypothetical protein